MTIKIELDAYGVDTIWCEVDGRPTALPADHILIRASDGHVFIAKTGLHGMSRLGPAEVEMVNHWLLEKGAAREPVVFAGDPIG